MLDTYFADLDPDFSLVPKFARATSNGLSSLPFDCVWEVSEAASYLRVSLLTALRSPSISILSTSFTWLERLDTYAAIS